jgi:hypothetical protein
MLVEKLNTLYSHGLHILQHYCLIKFSLPVIPLPHKKKVQHKVIMLPTSKTLLYLHPWSQSMADDDSLPYYHAQNSQYQA